MTSSQTSRLKLADCLMDTDAYELFYSPVRCLHNNNMKKNHSMLCPAGIRVDSRGGQGSHNSPCGDRVCCRLKAEHDGEAKKSEALYLS